MKKTLQVKNLTIGEGAPKICVSMTGKTLAELSEEATFLRKQELDIIEWRVDFFENVESIEKVHSALIEIRSFLPEIPLVFTFRTAKEGGEKELTKEAYFALNKQIIESGLVDFVDIELFNEESDIKRLIKLAHSHQTFVILSNHDFVKTPTIEEMVSRLRKAQALGGDLPKIAVMPKNSADVLSLLEATLTMTEKYADRPIITISMSGKGLISRLAGEIFGSAITFGAVKKASAPGQVPVKELKDVLSLLHKNL
ncbi:3-dehydroquinate dehydratase [Mesobacillus persicus]|uniref:3-dehydroquinate dehydratase n=1 Tax=Mesobacillus persicus TaxID=930146 RepID=A0A1H8FQZ4_9BACI|nr:type I 3-dehydroquinate dehydratase [Mesobacillus persicus]SEN34089.1 3-dehydroquinate dehydratase [Mesobacillus persicus]